MRWNCSLCDVKMPKMDGLTLLRHVKTSDAGIAAVMMSGHGDISTGVAAMKEGAFDYLVKRLAKTRYSEWCRKPSPYVPLWWRTCS